jgi:uncharacterized membrane protein YgaE (UPF0421/DUF939 family)
VSKDKEVSSNISFKSLILISTVVVIIQCVVGYIIYLKLHTWNDRADFGEMFGAVNTLFSGLAFAGVIYAIFLQRRELELQRNELEMTRAELRRSAEAQEKSESALTSQAHALTLTAKLNALNSFIEAQKNKLELIRSEGTHYSNAEYKEERRKFDNSFERLQELTGEIDEAFPAS